MGSSSHRLVLKFSITRSTQPVAHRSGAMALQPGPGTNCIAHEDGSELTMQSGTMASLILDCIPREGTLDDPRSNEDQYGVVESRSFPPSELLIDSGSRDIGVLNELHNKENQTKGELRQAKSTNFLASRPDAESSANSTPNVYTIPSSSSLLPPFLLSIYLRIRAHLWFLDTKFS